MRKHFGWRGRALVALLVAAVGLTVVATGLGKTNTKAHIAKGLACGLGNGQKATGTPIKLGAINVKQAGTDFTDIGNMANAYFQCVNANGGIYGHPIVQDLLTDQTDPAQVAADAKQLIETDKVVGIAGSSDIIDCAVNSAYYASQHFYVLEAGIAEQCYSSPFEAPVNMGPRYSADGATQTAISLGAKKIAFDQSNVPGTQYNLGGSKLIAKEHHIPITFLTENAAAINGATAAEAEVQAAGKGGAVVLVFTPPVALAILQGAQHLGLENKVIWTCATPCNTDFLSKSLGPQWNHKLYVNAEMNDIHDDGGADATLYLKVLKQYGSNVAGGIGSFSQFGFVLGQLAVKALLSIKSHVYTAQTVNAAFHALKNFKTDFLCKPWYFGPLPNNTDHTVYPDNGLMQIVPHSGCLPIDPVDPQVAKSRAYEKAHNV
ncbi:MAG: ABC transporter substrate-binding protein [Solirubrobacteraceae bacterium]